MEERWTSFWGHVDDLRQTLLRSIIVIGVGFLIALIFYQPLINFLTTHPHTHVTERLTKQQIQRQRIVNQTSQTQLYELPPQAWLISDSPSMIQGKEHPTYRLNPGESLVYEQAIIPTLLIMGPLEGLTLVVKFCFWFSLALTAPAWGWIWLQFILPGLRSEERKAIYPFLIGSVLCLALGIAFAYTVTLPITNQYLASFNLTLGENAWTLSHYINYVLLICTGHAIAAELGLILLILVHFRILMARWLIDKRRYMILLAFVLGALLTPPDILTQLLLAIPLIGLYEIAILYAKWRELTYLTRT